VHLEIAVSAAERQEADLVVIQRARIERPGCLSRVIRLQLQTAHHICEIKQL
jgi:hypothetical protein